LINIILVIAKILSKYDGFRNKFFIIIPTGRALGSIIESTFLSLSKEPTGMVVF
jgi:hypothetical protein